MKKYLAFWLAIMLSVLSFSAFAANTSSSYTIFVDAGSTGSRLHIFQYEKPLFSLPVVTDVSSKNVKPGLSFYADHPEQAGPSLKPLLDDAVQFLQTNKVAPGTVVVHVFGTAGMRLLSQDKQDAIYNNIKTYLEKNYPFFAPVPKKGKTLQTISGQMEGLYGWLDVNYLAGNFQNHQSTVGSIDMGGASTQIAFATNDLKYWKDEIVLNMNGKKYRVFSKSFKGLGQDQALATMSAVPGASACYPLYYEFSPGMFGYFNLPACSGLYKDNVIQNQHVTVSGKQSFIAFSGIYYTYNFFQADKTPDQSMLEERIKNVCSVTWDQLQKNYPKENVKYLSAYCANAAYDDELLYRAYGLQGNQLTVTNKINQKDIDWTLGAALYSLIK